MALNTIDILSSNLISNDSNVNITGSVEDSYSYVSDATKYQLNDYDGMTTNKAHFHHIKSTHTGNLSFIVTTAGGWGDTIIRLWEISSSSSGGDTEFNMNITNSAGLSLASGTTLIPSASAYINWKVMNDQVNGTYSSLEYPNFSSTFPLLDEQTTFYQVWTGGEERDGAVAGNNASAFDFKLVSGNEYLLEYGYWNSWDSGGSYQINIGSLTNINNALGGISPVIDPTGGFLGYVDIPSTDDTTERAYIFFNVETSTLTDAGQKGSILLNRIRKKQPIIPENATSITQSSSENTSLTTVEPIKNIPNSLNIVNGGKNFNVDDHIVICNKNSIHDEDNSDLFTTYRDAIFTNNTKAIYSIILQVTSITSNDQGDTGIINGLKIVNPNNIINILNNTINIIQLDSSNFNSTTSSYPDPNASYYIFVFDNNYLTDTSNSSLNTNCSGASIIIESFSTLLFIPVKYNSYTDNFFQNNFLYIPYLKDLYNFFINSYTINQHYVYHITTTNNYSDLINYTKKFLTYTNIINSMNPIPNILDNNYHRKSISSHKINNIHLTQNLSDQTLVHKSIPIISSGNQKTTIFDNVPETSFSENNPYILLDSNRTELDNIPLSELNIIPFSKDSFNPFSFSEKYILSYIKSTKRFKIKLNNFIVPYKFKRINTLELRYISLHIQNKNAKSNQIYGTSNITGGLLKCIPVLTNLHSSVKFIEFKCNESPIVNLNVKDDIDIQLHDPYGNILEPYENENTTIKLPNNNIQTSITIELISLDKEIKKEPSKNTNNNIIPSIDIGLNVPIVKSSRTEYEKVPVHKLSKKEEIGLDSNLENDPKQKQIIENEIEEEKVTINSNLENDPKQKNTIVINNEEYEHDISDPCNELNGENNNCKVYLKDNLCHTLTKSNLDFDPKLN
jgi:hypothetical protein